MQRARFFSPLDFSPSPEMADVSAAVASWLSAASGLRGPPAAPLRGPILETECGPQNGAAFGSACWVLFWGAQNGGRFPSPILGRVLAQFSGPPFACFCSRSDGDVTPRPLSSLAFVSAASSLKVPPVPQVPRRTVSLHRTRCVFRTKSGPELGPSKIRPFVNDSWLAAGPGGRAGSVGG